MSDRATAAAAIEFSATTGGDATLYHEVGHVLQWQSQGWQMAFAGNQERFADTFMKLGMGW